MDDLISRQAAIDAIEKLHIPEDMCVFEILSHIELAIGTLPSAQSKREKGVWKEREILSKEDGKDIDQWQCARCSECGRYHTTPFLYSFNDYNFCPHCGAKMSGGTKLKK